MFLKPRIFDRKSYNHTSLSKRQIISQRTIFHPLSRQLLLSPTNNKSPTFAHTITLKENNIYFLNYSHVDDYRSRNSCPFTSSFYLNIHRTNAYMYYVEGTRVAIRVPVSGETEIQKHEKRERERERGCVATQGRNGVNWQGMGGMTMQLHRPHCHVATFTWIPVDTYNGSARIVDSYCFVIGPPDGQPAGTECWISLYWKFPAPHFCDSPISRPQI